MKNIELKISINNTSEIVKNLKKIKAEFRGILKQKDTYYKCNSGRLKLREINNNKKNELIFYNRPNLKQSKISNYQIINFNKKNSKSLNYLLISALGKKITVDKERSLWIYKNTRIHLDKVKHLGKFLELETVVKKNNITKAKKEYNELYEKLNLYKFKKYNESYSDLLIKEK